MSDRLVRVVAQNVDCSIYFVLFATIVELFICVFILNFYAGLLERLDGFSLLSVWEDLL
jgi:hypothetical protein